MREDSQAREYEILLLLVGIVTAGIACATTASWLGGWFAFFGCSFVYYWLILGYGAYEANTPQRDRYDRFRAVLLAGGRIGLIYNRILKAALDAVDRLLGDQDHAAPTRLHKAFGLQHPSPLWTARSYDRCLLGALIYPIFVIIAVWAITGHVGPAEAALRLRAGASEWQRGIGLAGILLILLGWFGFLWSSTRIRRIGWFFLHVLSIVLVLASAGASLEVIAFAMAVDSAFGAAVLIAGTGALVGASANLGACSLAFAIIAVVDIAIAGVAAHEKTSLFALALFGSFVAGLAIATIMAWLLSRRAIMNRLAWFLVGWTLFALLLGIISPIWLASLPSWFAAGSLLLFMVILTVVNAPFDWATLGLTRALLRRGMERGGLSPLYYGIADLVAAAAIVVVLAIVTVLAIQAFTHATAAAGGRVIIHTDELLNNIADPSRTFSDEYLWVYFMLLSTLIPSVFNAAMGVLSIMRVPGFHEWLAQNMPTEKFELVTDRMVMAGSLAFATSLSVLVSAYLTYQLLLFVWNWEILAIGSFLIGFLQDVVEADVTRHFFNGFH